jgi:transposase
MSPNTTNTMTETNSVVHAGLDIAKAQLQLHLENQQHVLPNTVTGYQRLIRLLRVVAGVHVVCEATGGYERKVVAALHSANLPVSVVNPAQVRHFALAQGQRAKNDPIDAALLTAYGLALRPNATPVPQAVLAELRELVQWRDHLKEQLVRARQPAEHATLPTPASWGRKKKRSLAFLVQKARTFAIVVRIEHGKAQRAEDGAQQELRPTGPTDGLCARLLPSRDSIPI